MSQFSECPKCGASDFSSDIGVSDWEQEEAWVWRKYRCGCGFKWQEVYEFSHNETLDALHELDEKGNIKKT